MNLTPKIDQLMRSEHIAQVNEMLDAGDSPHSVSKWLASVGFGISAPTLYRYANMRREGLLNQAAVDDVHGEISVSDADDAAGRRLLTELQALDALIEKGYEAIKTIDAKDVTPKLMMDAIRLKHELTGGNHALLTGYGYSSLKKLDDKKWEMVVQFMMSFIQEEQQDEVRHGVEEIEERIYAGTPWQDEYVRARKETAKHG